jgi:hypothetical protein
MTALGMKSMAYRLGAALCAAAIFSLGAGAARADVHDAQAWLNVTGSGPVHGKLLAWAEVQTRFGEDLGRLSQTIVRPGVGYQLSKSLQLYVGYARVTNHNPGPDVGEDRLWQQLSWSGAPLAGGTLSTRTRLEQRFVETGRDTGWRMRQLVKYNRPFRPGGDTSLVLTSEAFVALDDADWGARSGFDQLRNFAGVGFSVAPQARIEAGYMNQYIDRAGPDDRMNHIASANLLVRF